MPSILSDTFSHWHHSFFFIIKKTIVQNKTRTVHCIWNKQNFTIYILLKKNIKICINIKHNTFHNLWYWTTWLRIQKYGSMISEKNAIIIKLLHLFSMSLILHAPYNIIYIYFIKLCEKLHPLAIPMWKIYS